MLNYPASIRQGESGLVVMTFPDVPEAVIVAKGADEAAARAPLVLETILAGYVVESRPIPAPSDIPDAPTIQVGAFSLTGMD
jgi:antitoxin HicB